jgi:hypothetical protein
MNKSLRIRGNTKTFLTIAAPGAYRAIFFFVTHKQSFSKLNQHHKILHSRTFQQFDAKPYKDIRVMSSIFNTSVILLQTSIFPVKNIGHAGRFRRLTHILC